MFKRKHYRFLLDWAIDDNLAGSTMERLANRLADDNPLFDRERFLVDFYKVKNARKTQQRAPAAAASATAARAGQAVDPEPRIRPDESFKEYADRIKSHS